MHIVCPSAKTSSSATASSSVVVATATASAFLSRTQLLWADRQTADGQGQLASERERERLTKPKPIRRRKRERRSGISRFRSLGKGGVLLSEAHPVAKWAPSSALRLYGLIGVKWRSEIELNKNATDDRDRLCPKFIVRKVGESQ